MPRWDRRTVLLSAGAMAVVPLSAVAARRTKEEIMTDAPKPVPFGESDVDWKAITEEEWRQRLTKDQFRILRKEGTEWAGTSPLNKEKRTGTYICAGCHLPLYSSEMKYESGTGWPSFFNYFEGALGFKKDFKLIYPRTEYHCARCGGHQGHVFKDGPEPTGLRYCNNGLALYFVADDEVAA